MRFNIAVPLALALVSVCAWAAEQPTLELQQVFGMPPNFSDAAWSPDGSLLAFADHELLVYDFETMMRRPLFGKSYWGIESVIFSPDGRYVAAGISWTLDRMTPDAPGPEVLVWDAQTGAQVAALRVSLYPTDEAVVATPLNFSTNGGRLLIKQEHDGQPGLFYLWDVANGSVLRSFDVLSATLSPEGFTVAVLENSKIKLVNIESGTTRTIYTVAPGSVNSITYNAYGTALLLENQEYGFTALDLTEGAKSLDVTPHNYALQIWEREQPFMSSMIRTWGGSIWELLPLKCLYTIPVGFGHAPKGYMASDASKILFQGVSPEVYDVATETSTDLQAKASAPLNGPVEPGTPLHMSGGTLWDVNTGQPLRGYDSAGTLAPDGETVALYNEGMLGLFNAFTNETYWYYGVWPEAVLFSPNSTKLLAVDDAYTAHMLNRDGDVIATFSCPPSRSGTAFSGNGGRVAMASYELGDADQHAVFFVWDAKTGALRQRVVPTIERTYEGGSSAVDTTCVSLSRTGEVALIGLRVQNGSYSDDYLVQVWDVKTPALLDEVDGTVGTFSPNDGFYYFADGGNILYLRDLAAKTTTEIATYSSNIKSLSRINDRLVVQTWDSVERLYIASEGEGEGEGEEGEGEGEEGEGEGEGEPPIGCLGKIGA